MSVFHDIIDKLEDIEKLLKKIDKNTTPYRFTGEEMKKAKKAFKDFESDRK